MQALLRADDVAELIAVDRKRVYELAAPWQGADRLPSVRFGRQIRFRLEDVQRFVEERTR
jgi:excisionase family DNA binding protein